MFTSKDEAIVELEKIRVYLPGNSFLFDLWGSYCRSADKIFSHHPDIHPHVARAQYENLRFTHRRLGRSFLAYAMLGILLILLGTPMFAFGFPNTGWNFFGLAGTFMLIAAFLLAWPLAKITKKSENVCFEAENESGEIVERFLNWLYKLAAITDNRPQTPTDRASFAHELIGISLEKFKERVAVGIKSDVSAIIASRREMRVTLGAILKNDDYSVDQLSRLAAPLHDRENQERYNVAFLVACGLMEKGQYGKIWQSVEDQMPTFQATSASE
jgi:hypothetical protein